MALKQTKPGKVARYKRQQQERKHKAKGQALRQVAQHLGLWSKD